MQLDISKGLCTFTMKQGESGFGEVYAGLTTLIAGNSAAAGTTVPVTRGTIGGRPKASRKSSKRSKAAKARWAKRKAAAAG